MKLRTIFVSTASLLLVALLFYACSKEWRTNPSSAETSLTINEAKQFFETNVLTKNNNAITERHSFSRRFLQKQNRWTKAFVKQLSIGEAVVVPLKFSSELYIYRENGKIHLPISDLSWMLFYRDSLHKIHAEVVTYLPNNAYFKDTAKHTKFSGIVTVTNWQGDFLKGFHYDSTGIRKVTSQEEIQANSNMRGTFNSSLMLLEQAAPPTCTATDWYTCVSDDGGNTFDCHYDYTEYDCSGGGGGDDGGGGGSPTGGDYSSLPPKPIGGGGQGSSIPTTDNTALLQNDLNTNPFGLLPCAYIDHFYSIAIYRPPLSVMNRLQELDQQTGTEDFFTQNIQNAAGTVINCDYFPVQISKLPTFNGQQTTPAALMNYFRLNIDQFINTSDADFSPYNSGTINDGFLWNSSNPLGALVHISIPGNSGTVVVSNYNTTSFTVTTIHSPFDHYHPVSGNREWSINTNTNGTYTFYTSAVDRITDEFTNVVNELTNIPFNVADDLWESLQSGMVNFINSHGGSATVSAPLILRPNYDDVKAVLNGQMSLSDFKKKLGC